MKEDKHKVVVVGASFGGQGFVHGLLLPEDGEVSHTASEQHFSVNLLDCRESFYLGAALQYVWTNRVSNKDEVSYAMSKMRSNTLPGVEFRKGDKGTVNAINVENKSVTLKDGSVLDYDSLILAPGVIPNPQIVPGLAESGAIDVCAWDQVDRFNSEIKALISLASVSSKPIHVVMSITRTPYTCPPLPFEVISLIDNELRSAGVRSSCHLFITVPQGFPFGGPPAEKKFCDQLKEMDIEYLDHHKIISVERKEGKGENDSLTSSSILKYQVKDEETSIVADAFFCTFPQRPPDFVQDSGLANKMGFITVDLQTNKAEGVEDIYVVGDCCSTIFPSVGKPHPKAGQFAYDMGLAVGKLIKSKVVSPESTPLLPTSRKGICAAECGLGGKGLIVKPNFSECIQNPKEGKPQFALEPTPDASQRKVKWMNGFLETFFGEGNFKPMI